MIISVKWNDKNSTFKIGEYTFNIMLNINVTASETVNKRKISLCIATKVIKPNEMKDL